MGQRYSPGFTASMGFADMRGRVSRLREHLGDGDFVGAEPLADQGNLHLLDPGPDRVTTGHDAGPSRGTDRGRRIAVRESHSRLRQGIDVRGAMKGTAVAADVGPAEIVDEEEYEVRRLLLVGLRRGIRDQERESGRQADGRKGSQEIHGR